MDPLFMGLRHVALNVRDVRKSLQFYSTVLGMQVEWMPDEDNAYLTSGSDNLALHKLPAGAEPGQIQTLHHIGFVVRQIDGCGYLGGSHPAPMASSSLPNPKHIGTGRDPFISAIPTVC